MSTQELLREIKVSALVTVALVILLCGVYPLVVWGVAQIAFPQSSQRLFGGTTGAGCGQ